MNFLQDNMKATSHSAELAALFREMDRPLLRFFAGRFGSGERAEDARQEVYLKYTEAGYAADNPPGQAIIFAIARNLFSDYLRRLRREREAGFAGDASVPPDSLEHVPAPEKPTDEVLILRQRLAAVIAVIDALPPGSREAFLLHRVQGLKYREIAGRMGVSVSRVEKLIARALVAVMKAK